MLDSFKLSNHVTKEGEFSKGIITYRVDTLFGYPVRVDIGGSTLKCLNFKSNVWSGPIVRIKESDTLRRYVDSYGLPCIFKLLYYMGYEMTKFLTDEALDGKEIYLDYFSSASIYGGGYSVLLLNSGISENLSYCVDVHFDLFKNKLTLWELIRKSKELGKVGHIRILPSKYSLLRLLYQKQGGTGIDKERGIRELVFNYPTSIGDMNYIALNILENTAKIVALGESFGFNLDEIISTRPEDSNDQDFHDIPLWSDSWFRSWEYSLYLKKLFSNTQNINYGNSVLFGFESGKMYGKSYEFKLLIRKKLKEFNRSWGGLEFYYQGKIESPLVYYSFIGEVFKTYFTLEYYEGLKKEFISFSAIYKKDSEGVYQYKDGYDKVIESIGLSPKKKDKYLPKINKKERIFDDDLGKRYKKFQEGSYFYIVNMSGEQPWGYKLNLSKRFMSYLDRMLKSGKMKEYWSEIYEFLENLNKGGMDYLMEGDSNFIFENVYKATKFSSLAQRFLRSLESKDFDTEGVEYAIRSLYKDAKRSLRDGDIERKRLEEKYGI